MGCGPFMFAWALRPAKKDVSVDVQPPWWMKAFIQKKHMQTQTDESSFRTAILWSLSMQPVNTCMGTITFQWIRRTAKRPHEAEAGEIPDKAPRTELWLLIHEQEWPAGLVVLIKDFFKACVTHLLWDCPYWGATTLHWQFAGPLPQQCQGLTESFCGVDLQCAWLPQQERCRDSFWLQSSPYEEASSSDMLCSSVSLNMCCFPCSLPDFLHISMSRWQDQGACNALPLKSPWANTMWVQERRQHSPHCFRGCHHSAEDCHSWKWDMLFSCLFFPFFSVTGHKPNARPEDFGSKPNCKAMPMPRTQLSCIGALLVRSTVTCIGEIILESAARCFCLFLFIGEWIQEIGFIGDTIMVLANLSSFNFFIGHKAEAVCRTLASPEVKAKPKPPDPSQSASRTLPLACLIQSWQAVCNFSSLNETGGGSMTHLQQQNCQALWTHQGLR